MMGGMLFFWALIIGGIVWLAALLSRQNRANETGADARRPLEILGERYARGEITRDQYEQMRRDLEIP